MLRYSSVLNDLRVHLVSLSAAARCVLTRVRVATDLLNMITIRLQSTRMADCFAGNWVTNEGPFTCAEDEYCHLEVRSQQNRIQYSACVHDLYAIAVKTKNNNVWSVTDETAAEAALPPTGLRTVCSMGLRAEW